MTGVLVKDVFRDEVLAEGKIGYGVYEIERCFYFPPDTVKMDNLVLTKNKYTCPYKGTCYYYALKTEDGSLIEDVAWAYTEKVPAPYQHIKGYIAFYPGTRPGVTAEKGKSVAATE